MRTKSRKNDGEVSKVITMPSGLKLAVKITNYYGSARKALVLESAVDQPELRSTAGEIYTVATVNLPAVSLEQDEVLIKDYSENEGVREALEKGNVIGPALASYRTGFAEVTKHKLIA